MSTTFESYLEELTVQRERQLSPSRFVTVPKQMESERRPNRYPGECVKCHQWVNVEEGWLTKDANDRWAAEHKECPEVVQTANIPEGYFYVNNGEGEVFLAIRKARSSGKIHVLQVVGGNDDQYRGTFRGDSYAGPLSKAVAVVLKDPETAAVEFGQRIGRCSRCGRHLTDAESRARGMGPECAEKGW